MINLIVATSINWIIWKNNKLLWNIPKDLKYFKELTSWNTCIMWRETFDSIISILWKPLPNRISFVISRNLEIKKQIEEKYENVFVFNSIEELLENIKDDNYYWVIWWWMIYKSLLPYVDEIYLTKILKTYEWDTSFSFNENEFSLISKSDVNVENWIEFIFEKYEKNK